MFEKYRLVVVVRIICCYDVIDCNTYTAANNVDTIELVYEYVFIIS